MELLMFARKVKCRVLENIGVNESVFVIRFAPSKKFSYQPGQFISVLVPSNTRKGKTVKRCYSLASSPAESKYHNQYEICVKLVPGGKGSTYLSDLRKGDVFFAEAAFGGFTYQPPAPGRSVVFICTGTGIGPFRSMVRSEEFLSNPPPDSMCFFGVRYDSELVYRKTFEASGVKTLCAVSRPSEHWSGFKGRVTDLLRSMPRDWKWHSTDFYICGSGEMSDEVIEILQAGHGVSPSAIYRENFTSPTYPQKPEVAAEQSTEDQLLPFPLPFKQAA